MSCAAKTIILKTTIKIAHDLFCNQHLNVSNSVSIKIMSAFQKQKTTIILGYSNGFGFRDTLQ